MRKLRRSLAAGLALAFLLTAGGCGSAGQSEDQSEVQGSASDSNGPGGVNIYSDAVRQKTGVIQQLIDKNFMYEIDPEKTEEAYYDGLLRGLGDKYATYYTPEEFAKVREEDEGEFVGIGVTVTKNMENGTIYVVSPIKNTPAEAAGLEADDIFVEIGDTALTTDMELEEVVKMIRGEEGTKVHIKVYRESLEDYVEFDVERQKIETISVEYEMLDNGYGYISISEFIEKTSPQFKAAVDDLVAQGAKGLIIDVRNNPGGLTNIVIEMVDYLIEDGQIPKDGDPSKPGLLLEMKDKNGKIMYNDYTKDEHSVDLPMAILMNGNSASSSEIMVGCLRDYGKAIMVGEKTYGKGIVQQTFPLTDGSAVKFTIAKYYLPSGSNIHETGIEPEVEVALTAEQRKKLYKMEPEEDPQLAAAIKALGGEPLKGSTTTETETTEKTETTESTESTESTEEP